jgi:aldehyde:ferredoxin oxidoreductase
LYDETNKHTDPLSPDNLLIFMTGPLTGSCVPCTGRHEIVFRSPLTDVFGRSGAGGKWGVELKKAGFDGLIVNGKADRPVYIFLDMGQGVMPRFNRLHEVVV